MYPGFSVPSSSSPYTTCVVSISAVVQEIPEKDFVLFYSLPQQILIAVLLRSPEGISKGGRECLPSANLSALHYTDIRLPAQSVKCSSLQEHSRENKISNLLSTINFWEDWSHGTQCENSNLTLGWTLAEHQVWGGETTRNEVTCRVPEEFRAVEWTFNSPSTAMVKTGRGEGGKALQLKLGMKTMQISEQTKTGKELFHIKPPSDLLLLEQRNCNLFP